MTNQKILVHAILTEPNLVAEAAVKQMLADASSVYTSIGITFELSSFEEVFGEGLEQDETPGPLPLRFRLSQTARSVRYRGRLVIFFRTGGNYSSSWGEEIVMGGADANTFIHEAGHFLHLGHTHNDEIMNQIYDTNLKQGYNKAKDLAIDSIRKAGGLQVFDGDSFAVKDTPPDPGPPLFQVSGYDTNGNAKAPDEHCNGIITLVVDGVSHQLAPDRTNIMSYFLGCPGNRTISPDQKKIIQRALTSGNRRHLIDGVSPEGPAAVTSKDGAIHVFARGDDLNIWYSILKGGVWSGWHSDLGAGTLTSGPAAVVSWDGAIHVFAAGTDRNIWHTYWKGNVWSGWRANADSGTFTSGPTAVVSSDGAIHSFARGDDRNIWHNVWELEAWSGWRANLGAGTVTSGPAAVISSDEAIHVFATGTDRNIWHTYWKGNVWSGWQANADTGTFTSGPTAVVSSDGAIHLFARGDDRRLWHNFWKWEAWRGWQADLSSRTFLSGAAAIVTADGVIHLFAQADDRNIWYSFWKDQMWSVWEPQLGYGTFQP
jgi:hypothetical protein